LSSKQQIRRTIREKRRALSDDDRFEAGQQVLQNLCNYPSYNASHRVAVYLANDGEIPLDVVIQHIWLRKRCCFLPVLFRLGGLRMHFAPFTNRSRFVDNQYNIPEPDISVKRQLKAVQLDLVLMPLVAFDVKGNRLGMGGGYYDRSFEFLRKRKHWKKPKLIGVAYDFQEVNAIPADPWDVPLDAIVTESRLIKF